MIALRPADNPFSSRRVESLAFRTDFPQWADLEQRLDELGGRAAIVGPKGSGKTTLLEEMARKFPPPIVWVQIPGSCPDPWRVARKQLPEDLSNQNTLLIDGAEQLGAFGWRRLMWRARSARCIVATLHQPGRLPTLVECRTDPALLRDLVGELVPGSLIPDQTLETLFERHGGNIRLCLRELAP